MVEFYKGSIITLGTGVIFLIITVVLVFYFSSKISICVFTPTETELIVGVTEDEFLLLNCDYVKSFVGVLFAFFVVGLGLIIYGFIERAKEKQTQIR